MGKGYDAVDRVMGRLFENGHRKERGGPAPFRSRAMGGAHRRPSVARLRRAGARDGKAIFKLVRRGGTQDRAGLKGQLEYLFRDDKLARVIDPMGWVERFGSPEAKDLDRLTRDWAVDWWKNTRNGNTSHMILSFPKGVSIDAVETITRAVCNEMFESGERRFKYIAAIHNDTAHHPHAHIVLNRRADDNTLFTMRSGSEFSYEGFRESMAAHGSRLGIYLDPSFRFERGLTAKQPDRDEQRDAQREGRAPRQLARTGEDLDHQRELISYARIAFDAMAVIAMNADCRRLEGAWERVSDIMAQEKEFAMPTLSETELEKFDQYVALLGDTIERVETVIANKSAAERAPMEKHLDGILRGFTALSPDAPYARDLHQLPDGGSIYQMRKGETPEALREDAVQVKLAAIAKDYGLDADAITARLETGAETRSLERLWVHDDAARAIAATGVAYRSAADQAVVRTHLEGAYAKARDLLVEAGALREPPYLDPDYRWRPEPPATYSYQPPEDIRDGTRSSPSRLTGELAALKAHYRETGAPEDWLRDNVATLRDDLAQTYRAEFEAAVTRDPELLGPLRRAISSTAEGRPEITDRQAAHDFVGQFSARHLERIVPDEMRQAVGEDLIARHPDLPHHVVDRLADTAVEAYHAVERQLAREARPFTDPDLERFARRNSRDGLLDLDRHAAQDLRSLLREKLTEEERDRLTRGDAKALRPLAADRGFALGVMALLEGDARVAGRRFSARDEDRLDANRRALEEMRDCSRSRDEDYGRDDGWER